MGNTENPNPRDKEVRVELIDIASRGSEIKKVAQKIEALALDLRPHTFLRINFLQLWVNVQSCYVCHQQGDYYEY